jgi:hypothetical protein
MTKERVSLDLPDVTGFKPRAKVPESDQAEIKEVAERAGFTARHSAQPATPPKAPASVAPFDARSLRRSNRTAKLNIATSEDTRRRFWELAQRMGISAGEDVLISMMDAYEHEDGRAGGR